MHEPISEERLAESDRATAVQDCRSEEGITVGLVDAIISILRVLAPRDLSTMNVQEALADLFGDLDFRTVRAELARLDGITPAELLAWRAEQ